MTNCNMLFLSFGPHPTALIVIVVSVKTRFFRQ